MPSGRAVLRGLRGLGNAAVAKLAVGGEGGVHCGFVRGFEASFGERWLAGAGGLFVAVDVGVALQELDAAAMAMHVAEAADVHEDVEAEAVPGAEGAEQLVVASAMLRAERDELGAARCRSARRRGCAAGGRSSGSADRAARWPVRPRATRRRPAGRRRARDRWAGPPSARLRRR